MTDRDTISHVIESLYEDWIDKNINVHPLAVENMRILEADALALLKEHEKPNGKCVNECECWDSAYERGKQDALKEQKAKTGHWVSVNDEDVVAIDNDGFPERACFCSECKKYLIASDEYAVYGRYCPFCGAKMESQ